MAGHPYTFKKKKHLTNPANRFTTTGQMNASSLYFYIISIFASFCESQCALSAIEVLGNACAKCI